MGRKITVYLTEHELKIMEALVTHYEADSVSQVVKNALAEMFSKDGLFLKEGVPDREKRVTIVTKGASEPMKKYLIRKDLEKKAILKKET